VGETVEVILGRVAERHGEDSLPNEFVDAIANASGFLWVEEALCDQADQAEAVLGFAKQDDPSVGGEPLIGALNFNGAVEIGLEKVTLSFTHRVVFSVFEGCCFLPVKRGISRDGFLFFPKVGE